MGLIRLLFVMMSYDVSVRFGPKMKAIVLQPECTTDSPGLKMVDF